MSSVIVFILPHTDVMFEFIVSILSFKIILLNKDPSENCIAETSFIKVLYRLILPVNIPVVALTFLKKP